MARTRGLDEQSCLELLEFLVEGEFLCRRNDVLTADGRARFPAGANGEGGAR
jgi:hypothetical protein